MKRSVLLEDMRQRMIQAFNYFKKCEPLSPARDEAWHAYTVLREVFLRQKAYELNYEYQTLAETRED